MSEIKHTPGDWEITNTSVNSGETHICDFSIGRAHTPYIEIMKEEKANGLLLAQAPAMYRALKDLLGDVLDLLQKNDSIKLGTMGTIHIIQAQEAIKKATA